MGRQIISKFKYALAVAVFGVLSMAGAGKVHASASYVANYVGTTVNSGWVSIETSGSVNMTAVPVATGTLVVGGGEVSVKTSSGSGYQLYVSGQQFNQSNRYAGLYLNGNMAEGEIAGLQASTPTTFTEGSYNKWGYGVANLSGFSSEADYNSAVTATNSVGNANSLLGTLKWKGLQGDYQHVASTNRANEAVADVYKVYYGAYLNNTMETGAYRNVIIYTGFVDGGDSVMMNNSVVPIQTAGGTSDVTIEVGHTGQIAPVQTGDITVKLYDSANPAAAIGTCPVKSVDSTYNGSGKNLKFVCTLTRGANATHGTTPSTWEDKKYAIQVRVDTGNGIAMVYESLNAWRYQGTWTATLNLNANGGSLASGVSPKTTTANEGSNATLAIANAAATKTNYDLKGWTTTASPAVDAATSVNATGGNVTVTSAAPTVTYHAVWNEITWTATLNLNANNGSNAPTVAGSPATLTQSANGTSYNFTIPANGSISREGFRFLGWSADQNATTASYTAGQTYTVNKSDPTKTLYAVWEATAKYMQTASTITECKNLSTGTLMEVVDNRDDKHYYVTKLKDGACWMVQNLDIDLYVNNCTTNNKTSGATGKMGTCKGSTFVEFTSSNTNISGNNWNVSGSNMAYDTQNATGTTWDSYGRAGGNNSYYEVRSHDPGNTCLTNGTTNATCTPAVGAAETRRDGNYYNWPAATAGTGTYQTAANGIASDSICPKGWHLPYGNNGTSSKQGNTKGGWYYLLNSLGTSSDSALLAAPYYLNRSGRYRYSDGSVGLRTSYGYYWSSMAYSANDAYPLDFRSSYVNPGTSYSNKGFGFSVRCVAE